MKVRKKIWLLPLGACLLCSALQAIDDYRPFFAPVPGKNGMAMAISIRQFRRNGRWYQLRVNPVTMATAITLSSAPSLAGSSLTELRGAFADTPYFKAMGDAAHNTRALQDAGITHALPNERGVCLTIDLCPTRRRLERTLFLDIVAAFAKIEKPVPLAIAVSGLWLESHGEDLRWLQGLVRSGAITVDWINHSYHHQYDPRLPLRQNFLLEKGVNLDREILLTEKKMIESGLTPSVFFRFPGLVSSQGECERVLAYGLIPVGSDAWLAKRQASRPGSIILIHGNGNEARGIKKFLALVARERKAIKQRNWLLFDLRDSVAREE
ncbi:MAG: polysaccharide deacetylase [Candidatus Aminicenantes bacterium]|nr:polysaccharide deacetylase [Candidatus Aminicenantes bacterium]